MADDYDSGMSPDQGIAELIATPGDVDVNVLKNHFPFINKVMALGNLSENDILDIIDLATIDNIQMRSGMTRLKKSRFKRDAFTKARAYMKAEVSLGKGGFAVRRITESTQTINTNQPTGAKRGLIGGLLGRGGNE